MSSDKDDSNDTPLAERKEDSNAPRDAERRRLLKLGVTTASVTVAGLSLGSVVLRMPMPAVLPGPSALVKIGDPSSYPVGVQRELEEAKIIVRSDADGLSAMSLVCTHLGCIVRQTQDGFDCPCHGSKFSPEGKVLRGASLLALVSSLSVAE